MALPSPFRWLEDLKGKPVACCLSCRSPYFPHLGGCRLWCFELGDVQFYERMTDNARIDRRVHERFKVRRDQK